MAQISDQLGKFCLGSCRRRKKESEKRQGIQAENVISLYGRPGKVKSERSLGLAATNRIFVADRLRCLSTFLLQVIKNKKSGPYNKWTDAVRGFALLQHFSA